MVTQHKIETRVKTSKRATNSRKPFRSDFRDQIPKQNLLLQNTPS